MLDAETLKSKFVDEKVMNILRIIAGVILLYYIIERSVYSWNTEIPAMFFFTVQSNLFLALYWILSPLVNRNNVKILPLIITANMVLTGIVFVTLLDEGFKVNLYRMLENQTITSVVHYVTLAASYITHFIMPILALLDFLFFTDFRNEGIRRIWPVMLYPFSYFIFHIIYSAVTGKYIYPFFNPGYVGGWGIVALFTVILIAGLLGIAVGITTLNRVVQKQMYRYYNRLLEL